MHESLFVYRNKRYLWLAILISAAGLAAYVIHEPFQPKNGGTWLGYTLGTLGAVLIIWLMAFGIRKRRYHSTSGTVQGWLSAHVYLGTALILIATLHSGLQFGWNVHTLAYVLMCIVILSGIFGAWMYWRNPRMIAANKTNLTRVQMLEQVADLDRRAVKASKELSTDVRDLVASAANRTQIGGGVWSQLTGQDRSNVVLPGPSTGDHKPVRNPGQKAASDWLAAQIADSEDPKTIDQIQELTTLISSKVVLLDKLRRDIQLQGWLEIWLYVHVPLAFALLAALCVHVIAVFLYW
ncbi:MAG: hypothetical protein ACR2QU_08180 [Gammaproteobacteria bacterium]